MLKNCQTIIVAFEGKGNGSCAIRTRRRWRLYRDELVGHSLLLRRAKHSESLIFDYWKECGIGKHCQPVGMKDKSKGRISSPAVVEGKVESGCCNRLGWGPSRKSHGNYIFISVHQNKGHTLVWFMSHEYQKRPRRQRSITEGLINAVQVAFVKVLRPIKKRNDDKQ